MSFRQVARIPPRSERIKAESPAPQEDTDTQALVEGIDELLDEIDAVLEEQAVLVNFRQRGGQ